MLTKEQEMWCLQRGAPVPVNRISALDFLSIFGKLYWPVEIEIHSGKYLVYCHNKMGKGETIAQATRDLITKLCPTPDPDPYLVENLIETLAPGTYPTYADKVSAAEIRSMAEADGHLIGVL